MQTETMKQNIILCTALSVLLTACDPTPMLPPSMRPQVTPQPTATVHRLMPSAGADTPAVAPTASSSDANAAFERQVAAYARQAAEAAAAGVTTPTAPGYTLTQPTAVQTPNAAPIPQPTAAPTQPEVQPTPTPEPQPAAPVSSAGNMNYKVSFVNGTDGRLFLEATDAADNVYPCGFMAGRAKCTESITGRPAVNGPIKVVVRDPDQDGAPVLREYSVPVPDPSAYNGGTLQIEILPRGSFRASANGVPYFTKEPVAPPPAPANPAPTPAAPAPAPESAQAPAS